MALLRVFFLLILISIILPFRAAAQDPCDFASSGSDVFPREQILACFESVPFDRGDLDNILAVISQARSFSDLAEWYDARNNWVEHLAVLAQQDFPNDFAMHNALIAEHKRFKVVSHVSYDPPACYSDMFAAFVPLDFGATTRFARLSPHDRGADREKQIVFIEDAPEGFREFYQQVTGIDTQEFVGLRVVAINGVPVLDHFRAFGREELQWHDSDGVHLNLVLNQPLYRFRAIPTTSLPERSADEYLLETRDGERFSVTLPWVFVWSGAAGDPAPALTASTEEFVALCRTPRPPFSGAQSEADDTPPIEFGKALQLDLEQMPDPQMFAQYAGQPYVGNDDEGFFEVPPGQLGKHIEVIIPSTDGAQVLQFRRNVTAIRIDHTRTDWTGVVREGVEHACQNSKRLIIDVRGADGGLDDQTHWLHRHLFPEETDPIEAGKFLARTRNDNDKLNEIYYKSAFLDSLELPQLVPFPCAVGLGTRCFLDPDTGEPPPLGQLDWFLNPSFLEERGGVPVSLSRQFALLGFQQNFFDFDFTPASCAGRFKGDDLIFLTDGLNKSGTYILPAAFKGKSVIVTMGGFVDEPMPMGIAAGGVGFDASQWADTAAALRSWPVAVDFEYVQFERQVESQMEMWATYRKDRTTLNADNPVKPDLRLHVWSDSPQTDGYVYGRLLKSVDAAARRRGRRR